eukprot:g8631.t1
MGQPISFTRLGPLICRLVFFAVALCVPLQLLFLQRDVLRLYYYNMFRNQTAETLAGSLLGQVVYLSPLWIKGRAEHIEAQLKQFNLSHFRDAGIAINTTQLSMKQLRQLYPDIQVDCPEENHMATAVVYINHHLIMEKVCSGNLTSNGSLVLVLEDDAVFHPLWGTRLLEYLKTAPPDWDVLRIGGWGEQREEDRIANSPWFRCTPPAMVEHVKGKPTYYYFGAVAYLLRSGSSRVCDYFRSTAVCFTDLSLSTKELYSYQIDLRKPVICHECCAGLPCTLHGDRSVRLCTDYKDCGKLRLSLIQHRNPRLLSTHCKAL